MKEYRLRTLAVLHVFLTLLSRLKVESIKGLHLERVTCESNRTSKRMAFAVLFRSGKQLIETGLIKMPFCVN